MGHSPVISVIVPVCNAESTLARCVDSLLGQTFTDFEVLLIDDGSRDASPALCDAYAARDPRVRVFHKENGGVSSARNVGLDNARGEWIAFVDSDDWVEYSYLRHLIDSSGEAELVISYAQVYRRDGSKEVEKYPASRITKDNASIMFLDNAMSWHTSPWSKLFNRRIVETLHLRFPENVHIGEDAVFLYTYMLQVNSIQIVSFTDYCYQSEQADSLTKRLNSVDSEWRGMELIHSLVERMKEEWNLSEQAQRELNWLKASYVHRVLNALYYNSTSFIQRRTILYSLDLNGYVKYISPNTRWMKSLVFLLKHRNFLCYDISRKAISKIKQWRRN